MNQPETQLQILIFQNGLKLISQIQEKVVEELGDPNCILIEPFEIIEQTPYLNGNVLVKLVPWFLNLTAENKFVIHSDKIFTSIEPNVKLKKLYEKALTDSATSFTDTDTPTLLNE